MYALAVFLHNPDQLDFFTELCPDLSDSFVLIAHLLTDEDSFFTCSYDLD
jgi:hypothetical protein